MVAADPGDMRIPEHASKITIRRHSVFTRLTHWLNVLCLSMLLMSGLQIFNAYPSLHWGQYGADNDPSFAQIGSEQEGDAMRGYLRIGSLSVTTTGVLGVSDEGGERAERAFPSWITIPSYQDLAAGRRWHFFFAWLFVINGFVYLAASLVSGHLRRDLAPTRADVSPRHIWHEIVQHARLRFPEGEAARHYNVLQKLTYLLVIFGFLPLMVATGLTMSPGIDAGYPFLLDLFGGRQSARLLHFFSAWSIVLFVLVHVAMVILSGFFNNMRSMITGRYAIRIKEKKA